jgi:nitrogen regulatory protein P-II 1
METSKSRRRDRGNVQLRKVTAIVRVDVLERVERRLQELRVPGVSVMKGKGYGEYENFFARDWMTEHARIEIFLRRERADEVARAIVDAAHTGGAGDGIVVVLPVESIYRIRSRDVATSDELGGCECMRSSSDKTRPPGDPLGPT